MKSILHTATSRGHANHGWLNTYHTFSFANYYNPDRIYFGALRVLNDDTIAAGMGFGTHPHDNMEIITIPLEGDIQHKDSMGNGTVIHTGEIQVMSAGSGITHSEFNPNPDKLTRLLQIWIMPNKRNVSPRYNQLSWKDKNKHNELQQILSPNPDDTGVWIHQNAWFHMGSFDAGKVFSYALKDKKNGLYIFVISGGILAENIQLADRDGLGVWDTEKVNLSVITPSTILLIEVPMTN